jgi:hypothetical protein
VQKRAPGRTYHRDDLIRLHRAHQAKTSLTGVDGSEEPFPHEDEEDSDEENVGEHLRHQLLHGGQRVEISLHAAQTTPALLLQQLLKL